MTLRSLGSALLLIALICATVWVPVGYPDPASRGAIALPGFAFVWEIPKRFAIDTGRIWVQTAILFVMAGACFYFAPHYGKFVPPKLKATIPNFHRPAGVLSLLRIWAPRAGFLISFLLFMWSFLHFDHTARTLLFIASIFLFLISWVIGFVASL